MSNQPLILIVEDDALLRLELIFEFEAAGIETLYAENADVALTLLDDERITGLVTDVDMPGRLNGLDVARAFAGAHPGKPLVVNSGGLSPVPGVLPAQAIFIPKPAGFSRYIAALGLADELRHAA